MHLQTVTYGALAGWSAPLPVDQNGSRTLVLAFAAAGLADDDAPFQALRDAFPGSLLAGCSTAGEIAGAQVHDDSFSVAIARFEHTDLRRACTAIDSPDDSLAAGARLAAQLGGDGLRAVFVLSDGLRVNGSLLVEGLTRHLPADVVVTGGLAGDGSRFQRTWVLQGGAPKTHVVCAVGFYGERLRIGVGCEGGWSHFGPERRITRSQGNVLFELDGKPALDLYKTYLGERAAGLPGTALLFPLSVAGEGQETLVRTILAIDEKRKSMTFAGDLPAGGSARLMRANTDKLIDSAGQAARTASAGADLGAEALVISVSCVGRRLVLGERTDEEAETVAAAAPERSAHVGFYSYGEISPSARGNASQLHNQTMTVTVFSEA